LLLTFYYKYDTYRCSAQKKFDWMSKLFFFTIFLIFHVIKIFLGGLYGTYKWKLRKFFPNSTFNRTVRINDC
jgi:hypothetical protein